ncbi:MAG: prolyl aminopeptidase [Pseudomonadales bacterium]|nr:prolyl aminopeptidase [Pseudomonadales bacterium]MCP5213654.1 prolyl aminopeptidase [Pseudomonadales bacterium]
MLILYPEVKPYNKIRLKVSKLHEIYIEECGNPRGIPVLVVHGGPGAGCDAAMRRFFDTTHYRIILFDQRGAGRSLPHAELEENTTQALIADMEAIRHKLQIEQWVLFGGSWGSTLSLAYAQAHPEKVLALILRGIFLCRDQDLHWFYQDGASHIFPDYWEDYQRLIPEDERDDYIAAYHQRLVGPDEVLRMAAAKAWSVWEARCATLRPNHDVVEHFTDPHVAMSLARIEAHYFVNNIFLPKNHLLLCADKLEKIPGVIVHGRYDMVCPLDNALDLHRAWPESHLEIVRDAGHSALEPGIVDALVRATRDMASRFEYLIGPM